MQAAYEEDPGDGSLIRDTIVQVEKARERMNRNAAMGSAPVNSSDYED